MITRLNKNFHIISIKIMDSNRAERHNTPAALYYINEKINS